MTSEEQIAALKSRFFRAWTKAARGAHVLGPGSLHCCAIEARELGLRQDQIAQWHREWKAKRD